MRPAVARAREKTGGQAGGVDSGPCRSQGLPPSLANLGLQGSPLPTSAAQGSSSLCKAVPGALDGRPCPASSLRPPQLLSPASGTWHCWPGRLAVTPCAPTHPSAAQFLRATVCGDPSPHRLTMPRLGRTSEQKCQLSQPHTAQTGMLSREGDKDWPGSPGQTDRARSRTESSAPSLLGPSASSWLSSWAVCPWPACWSLDPTCCQEPHQPWPSSLQPPPLLLVPAWAAAPRVPGAG